MIARQLGDAILRLLEKYPVISLTGPRQSGKTTLLKNLLPTYRYVNLEDAYHREFAQNDLRGFLKEFDDHVIFDEAQRVPSLFSAIQVKADEAETMGRFVLSGSQNFLLLEKISQSLAGRAAVMKLLPFSLGELTKAGLLDASLPKAIFQGGFPSLFDRGLESWEFFPGYVETYLERDVRSVTNVQDLRQFRNFMRLCAGRAGQLLNIHSLAVETGVSAPTVQKWLSILEASYVIFLLPPFFENFNKRVVKSPKLYFYSAFCWKCVARRRWIYFTSEAACLKTW